MRLSSVDSFAKWETVRILFWILSVLSLGGFQPKGVQLAFDPTFQPAITVNSWQLTGFAVAPDGKIYVSGAFDRVNGVPKATLVRLNPDGSIDPSFRYQAPNTRAYPLVVRNDGPVLVTTGGSLDWLDPDGSFRPSIRWFYEINRTPEFYRIELLPDGKLMVGGTFDTVPTPTGNVLQRGLARFNADGSLDTGFVPERVADGQPFTFRTQPDGKVLLAPWWDELIRLNRDGSIDSTFKPAVDREVRGIILQPDGRMIVAGAFSSANGAGPRNLARLNSNGSLDLTFPGSAPDAPIIGLFLQPDGRFLIRSQRIRSGTLVRTNVARLNADGGLDPSFTWPGFQSAFGYDGFRIVPLASGKILVQRVVQPSGTVPSELVQLNNDGSIDEQFKADLRLNGTLTDLLVQSDGKVILTGYFDHVNDVPRKTPFRLNPDGTLDSAFAPTVAWQFPIIETSGQLIGASSPEPLVRLNPDGSQDLTFATPAKLFGGPVTALAIQSDGKAVAGTRSAQKPDGSWPTNSVLARFNANGSVDPGFTSPFTTNSSVHALASLTNGRTLVGGLLIPRTESRPRSFCRLDVDGSIDPTFAPPADPETWLMKLVLRNDGKILIQSFDMNGNGISNLIRFDAGGNVEHELRGCPGTLVGTDDGQLLFAIGRNIIRLNEDGSTDASFGVGPNFVGGSMSAIIKAVKLPGGAYVMIGGFAVGAEQTRRQIVRLLPTAEPVPPLFRNLTWNANGQFNFEVLLPADYPYRVEAAATLAPFIWGSYRETVTNLIGASNWIPVTDPASSRTQARFYRMMVP